MKLNEYEMKPMLEIAQKASSEIEKYLNSMSETIAVINVEDDKDFQKQDVDLLWIHKGSNTEYMRKVEIKGDRYYKTGNFFLETESNREKGTPGCFLYTEADYIFYYFIDTRELNVIPVQKSRKWFMDNIHRFEEKLLSTKVGEVGYYTSAGRLVPKKIMREELGIKSIIIPERLLC